MLVEAFKAGKKTAVDLLTENLKSFFTIQNQR